MKKIYNVICSFALLLASCAEDGEGLISSNGVPPMPVVNTELMEELKARGYSYDGDGYLIVDEKVLSTTSLDLSGCELKTVHGLAMFSSLTDLNLANNDFGSEFNFLHLPSSVRSLDLTQNESLVDYDNLIQNSGRAHCENLRLLKLPASAMWNMEDVVDFAASEYGAVTDIQIMNEQSGELEDYSYLRDIPDVELKAKLEQMYPSMFDVDSGLLDLSRTMSERVDLILTEEYADLTGVEYIFCNPDYLGDEGRTILVADEEGYTMKYFRPAYGVRSISMRNIATVGTVLFDKAVDLKSLRFDNNPTLTGLTLNYEDDASLTNIFNVEVYIKNCVNFKELNFPASESWTIGKIHLEDLPQLTTLDLSQMTMANTIVLKNMPALQITNPMDMSFNANGWGGYDTSNVKLNVAFDQSVNKSSFVTYCSQNAITLNNVSVLYFGEYFAL